MESKKHIDKHGTELWLNHKNERHREDGPAIISIGGTLRWYKNNKRHREDGPAVEYYNGTKQWYKEGKLHRMNGPAITEGIDGDLWYIEGKQYSELEYKKEMRKYKIDSIWNQKNA